MFVLINLRGVEKQSALTGKITKKNVIEVEGIKKV